MNGVDEMQLNTRKNKGKNKLFNIHHFINFKNKNLLNNKNQIKRTNNPILKIIYNNNNLGKGSDINQLKNENFIDSHFETIKKVEDLINKMDKRKKTNNKQRLFRKNNHSTNKFENKLFTKNCTINSEFISNSPNQIDTSGNQYFEKNSSILNDTISEMDIIQDEKMNNQSTIENIPSFEKTDETDYQVSTEIELEKNEKSETKNED